MKVVRGDGREPGDDEVQGALRALYAPPADESYWAALERRIIARVGGEAAREWWSYIPAWSRIGLAAAAAALLVASVAVWQSRTAQARLAYESLIETPEDIPVLSDAVNTEPSARTREATLRYLIAHD
jgi:hypothetical protein